MKGSPLKNSQELAGYPVHLQPTFCIHRECCETVESKIKAISIVDH